MSEYKKFDDALKASLQEDGELSYKRTKDESDAMFAALNKITPEVPGVTKADLQEAFKYAQFFIKRGLNPLTAEIKSELIMLADADLATMRGWDAETVAKAKAAE